MLYIEKTKDGHVTPVDVTEIVDFSCGPNHTVKAFKQTEYIHRIVAHIIVYLGGYRFE